MKFLMNEIGNFHALATECSFSKCMDPSYPFLICQKVRFVRIVMENSELNLPCTQKVRSRSRSIGVPEGGSSWRDTTLSHWPAAGKQ